MLIKYPTCSLDLCQDVVNALFFLPLLVVVLCEFGGHGGRLLLFLVLRLVLTAAVNVTPEVAPIGQRVEVQTLGEDVWSLKPGCFLAIISATRG